MNSQRVVVFAQEENKGCNVTEWDIMREILRVMSLRKGEPFKVDYPHDLFVWFHEEDSILTCGVVYINGEKSYIKSATSFFVDVKWLSTLPSDKFHFDEFTDRYLTPERLDKIFSYE